MGFATCLIEARVASFSARLAFGLLSRLGLIERVIEDRPPSVAGEIFIKNRATLVVSS